MGQIQGSQMGSNMSDLEQQIQTEQQRLYEVSSLTDEMQDDEAQVLLEWASAQVPKIAGDGSKLEERAKKLRYLMKSVSYFVGNAEGMSPEEMPQELERIHHSASDLNYPIQSDYIQPLVGQLAGQNAGDILVIIIAWIENDSLLSDALG